MMRDDFILCAAAVREASGTAGTPCTGVYMHITFGFNTLSLSLLYSEWWLLAVYVFELDTLIHGTAFLRTV